MSVSCPSQTSSYPVILSLENHCSVKQQEVMAHHMRSILGSALVTSPLGDAMPTDFPSPEVCFAQPFLSGFRTDKDEVCRVLQYSQELKGKFLVKAKRLNKLEAAFAPETPAAEDTDVTEEEESNDEDDEEEEERSKVCACVTARERDERRRRPQQTFIQ